MQQHDDCWRLQRESHNRDDVSYIVSFLALHASPTMRGRTFGVCMLLRMTSIRHHAEPALAESAGSQAERLHEQRAGYLGVKGHFGEMLCYRVYEHFACVRCVLSCIVTGP